MELVDNFLKKVRADIIAPGAENGSVDAHIGDKVQKL